MSSDKENNNIDWCLVTDQDIIPTVKMLVKKVDQISLRTLHYNLVSREIIPNTRSAYNKLSKIVRDVRKDGRISWESITDETRHTIANFHDFYVSPEDAINSRIQWLDKIHESYTTNVLYRGYKQKYYIEIWLEKNALVSTFVKFLDNRHVRIVPNRGYSSWTYAYENCKRLAKMQMELDYEQDQEGNITRNDSIQKEIVILYYGDYDPSGKDMDNTLDVMLEYFKGYFKLRNVRFERVAVTFNQIKKFKLPYKPDKKTEEKVRRDNRTNGFEDEHGGVLYVVELDALLAYVPEKFEKLVKEFLDKYYDSEVYDELLEQDQHKPGNIRCLVIDKVRAWLKRMED